MFSTPFRAVFYVLAQAFMKLYHMPAEWQPTDEHEEFTGADMMARIDANDAPDVGTDLPDNRTNVPAEVFNSGADVAAVFTAPPAPPAADPIYTLTGTAGDFTIEQLINAGWSHQTLVDAGHAIVEYPVAPKPPAPPVPPTPPAPPSALTNNTAAISTPGAVEGTVPSLDKDGIPWDARIHSSSKKRNADNTWSRRKNVPDATYNQIRAELMQRGGGVPFAAPQAAHVPLAPPAAPAAPKPPTAAVVPVPPAPPGSNHAGGVIIPSTGKELVLWASANGLGPLFGACAQHMGLVSFGLLTHENDPARIAQAYSFLATHAPK